MKDIFKNCYYAIAACEKPPLCIDLHSATIIKRRVFRCALKKPIAILLSLALVSLLAFTACSSGSTTETGAVTLSITDAPLEDDTLTGVWITFTGVDFHTPEGGWQAYEGNLPDGPINLMLLNNGVSEALGTEIALPAGQYTQIRFLLDIQDTADGVPTNPGCFLSFDDDADPSTADIEVPLFVPSGDTSGYKAVGSFTVPVNGTVSVTADFDLRKAVNDAGTPMSPHFILKPTIRIVVDGQAGWIHGPVVPEDVLAGAAAVVVYAYADGTWADSETDEPLDPAESRFANSVTSASVDFLDVDPAESAYKLAFLAAGVYDLAVATFDAEGAFIAMWGFYNNAEVVEQRGTSIEISNANLSSVLE